MHLREKSRRALRRRLLLATAGSISGAIAIYTKPETSIGQFIPVASKAASACRARFRWSEGYASAPPRGTMLQTMFAGLGRETEASREFSQIAADIFLARAQSLASMGLSLGNRAAGESLAAHRRAYVNESAGSKPRA